jgi:hypothetical protein
LLGARRHALWCVGTLCSFNSKNPNQVRKIEEKKGLLERARAHKPQVLDTRSFDWLSRMIYKGE